MGFPGTLWGVGRCWGWVEFVSPWLSTPGGQVSSHLPAACHRPNGSWSMFYVIMSVITYYILLPVSFFPSFPASASPACTNPFTPYLLLPFPLGLSYTLITLLLPYYTVPIALSLPIIYLPQAPYHPKTLYIPYYYIFQDLCFIICVLFIFYNQSYFILFYFILSFTSYFKSILVIQDYLLIICLFTIVHNHRYNFIIYSITIILFYFIFILVYFSLFYFDLFCYSPT